MKHNGAIISLTEAELKTIFVALAARTDWLNENFKGTGDDIKPLAKIFENAEGASITIAYKL
jgi:hypothetical protein